MKKMLTEDANKHFHNLEHIKCSILVFTGCLDFLKKLLNKLPTTIV